MTLATILFGYLAGPECRRALARGWVIVVRTLIGLVLALMLACLLWLWWMNSLWDPGRVPVLALRYGLWTALMIVLGIVVVQAPAVLAGSLAGERERGVLQLLLTTAVTPREIVSGRLAGKLSQVAMIELAGLPVLAILFAWNGLNLGQLAAFFVLVAAVGFGAGGMAVAASVVSRRGRDALLSVYILMLILLVSPLLSQVGLPAQAAEWLYWFNPVVSVNTLVEDGHARSALVASVFWLAVGLVGVAVASWRMRPTCLAAGDTAKKSRRPIWVPPLAERPMLWKELCIERVGTLGRFGRWLGVLITVAIGGGSLVLGAIILTDVVWPRADGSAVGAANFLSTFLTESGTFLGWLLQWAIGLRAAVAIASERERGTWDALLMSPLEAGEIVRAKVIGSLYALRWMVAAMVLAWLVAASVGAVSFFDGLTWIVGNAIAGTLMAALGVRCSLSLPTATKAMTWTSALWMVGRASVNVAAFSMIAIGFLGLLYAWLGLVSYGYMAPNSLPWMPPVTFGTWMLIFGSLATLLFTFLIVLDTALRFDRIAGRMAGGAVASTVDEFLHGHNNAPVFLPDKKPTKVRKPEPPSQSDIISRPVASIEVAGVD